MAVQLSEPQQVLEYVGGGQQPVDAAASQCHDDALEQLAAVSHCPRLVTHTKDAARRMVGGDDHEAPVIAEKRPPLPLRRKVQ